MSKIKINKLADQHFLNGDIHEQVVAKAKSAQLKIYIVGGVPRDLLLNQYHPAIKTVLKDIDYAIAGGGAFLFAKEIAKLFKGHFVALDEKNDTARVVMPDGLFLDFAGCIGGSIEEDIGQRDFTINSLCIEPDQLDTVIDLTSGIDDIKGGIIRSTHASLFADDPLRLLRAFRFASCWQFSIDKQTNSWIKEHAPRLANVAGERISSELNLIFAASLEKILPDLASVGLLEVIFPELIATRQVTSNTHHHLNLFDHSLETALQAEKEFAKTIWSNTNLGEEISFSLTRLAACKTACLLHDIGKPATWVIAEDGRHTFVGHEKLGEQMITPIAERLRWSKHLERFVSLLVRFHLRPGQLFHQLIGNDKPSQRAINRLFRQSGEDFPALILLALGDLAATQGQMMTKEKTILLEKGFYSLLHQFYAFTAAETSRTILLDGNDVMRLLNIPAGKEIGEILLALREAQEINEVLDRSQAEDLVRSLYKKQNKNG